MQKFAALLAALTLALVCLGGVVHNTGSSLACPDWPLCNGSAFPRMAGAVLIEHGHRLTALAVTVGTWDVEAWHERFGTKTGKVTVQKGKPAEVKFEFNGSETAAAK